MTDWKIFFDHPVKNDLKIYENIWEMATGQGDDYTTAFLLDYNYFKDCYKVIETDLSKQQALDANPKAIQQINCIGNLDWGGQTAMHFVIEEAKETVLVFHKELLECCHFFFVLI